METPEYIIEEPKPRVITREEANRLKKEPFKVMAKNVSPELANELKGWIEPKEAYVLAEIPGWRLINEGERVRTNWLVTVNVRGRPERLPKLERIRRKGGRILHYGRFPGVHLKSDDWMAIVKLYSGPNGSNPWAKLAQECDRMIGEGAGINWASEKAKLEDERNELQRRLDAATNGKGKKDGIKEGV